MNRLRSQTALELWILRPYARQFVLLPVLGVLLGFLQDTIVPMMVVMVVLTASYAFSITENSRLETLFTTLPTTRARVVVARYLVITVTLVVAALFGLGFDAARAVVAHQAWSPIDALLGLGLSLAAAGAVLGIQFPFYFALGYSRARIITWVVIALVGGGIGLLLAMTGPDSPRLPAASVPVVPIGVGGILLCLMALAVSALASVHLYSRKDL